MAYLDKTVPLSLVAPRFYVPWRDISEGISNIFAQQFIKDHTIATPFTM